MNKMVMETEHMAELEVGRVYTARNQGTAVTPRNVDVTVLWLEEGHVYYLVDGDTVPRQTPTARFLEIVGNP